MFKCTGLMLFLQQQQLPTHVRSHDSGVLCQLLQFSMLCVSNKCFIGAVISLFVRNMTDKLLEQKIVINYLMPLM